MQRTLKFLGGVVLLSCVYTPRHWQCLTVIGHQFVSTKTADEILKKASRQTTSNAGH
ncbi:hypothetical protein [Mycobacterium sp.]|uniref:hypothetical protein n=1 Tax=Mycobacterium sp. TaxID=1785 RepID=UPI003C733558